MKKLLLVGASICGAMLLTACVQMRADQPLLVVTAQKDGAGCRITVEGERVTDRRLLEVGRSALKRRAIVLYDKNTPYKCIGGSIFTLQRAGVASVDAAMWGGN